MNSMHGIFYTAGNFLRWFKFIATRCVCGVCVRCSLTSLAFFWCLEASLCFSRSLSLGSRLQLQNLQKAMFFDAFERHSHPLRSLFAKLHFPLRHVRLFVCPVIFTARVPRFVWHWFSIRAWFWSGSSSSRYPFPRRHECSKFTVYL